MKRMMLILTLLVPGLAGCVVAVDDDRGHDRHHSEGHPYRHCVGCGHVYRGGIWVRSN